MSRSIYLIRPDWQGERDDLHEAVVATLSHGPRYIQIALELWRLVGQEDRAEKIEALVELAHERNYHDLNARQIEQLGALLEGLDDAIKRSWLDDRWQILPHLLSEIRRRTSSLDLDDHQGHLASEGVSEGLASVHDLRDFLKRALDQGLHLALD